MKQYKVEKSFRGVGDCKSAKGSRTYGLVFESVTEARKIAKAIHDDMVRNAGLIRDDDLAQIPLPIERRNWK